MPERIALITSCGNIILFSSTNHVSKSGRISYLQKRPFAHAWISYCFILCRLIRKQCWKIFVKYDSNRFYNRWYTAELESQLHCKQSVGWAGTSFPEADSIRCSQQFPLVPTSIAMIHCLQAQSSLITSGKTGWVAPASYKHTFHLSYSHNTTHPSRSRSVWGTHIDGTVVVNQRTRGQWNKSGKIKSIWGSSFVNYKIAQIKANNRVFACLIVLRT